MSKDPFYKVRLVASDEDLSDYISSFSHEDCVKEDDLLKFTMHDLNRDFIDNPAFVEGAELLFHYGYYGYETSNTYTAVIKTIEISYGKTIDITVVALDKGNNMKSNSSSKIWKNLTSTEIVEMILKKYGMTLSSDPTKKRHVSICQGNRSDFEFIRYLTQIEDGGSYMFYVKNFEGFFIKRDLTKGAVATFKYDDGDGKVLSFRVVQKNEGNENGKKQTQVSGVDPMTGEEFLEKVDATNVESEGSLGKYTLGPGGELDFVTTGEDVPYPAQSSEDAKNVANNKYKSASLKEVTATLITEGSILIKAGDLIAIYGVAKKHEGNWWVTKVAQDISTGGWIRTIELDKNGTKAAVSSTSEEVKEEDVNKIILDEDGNILDGSVYIPTKSEVGAILRAPDYDRFRR